MPLQRQREIGEHRTLQRGKQRSERHRSGAIEQACSSRGERDGEQVRSRVARERSIDDQHEWRIHQREIAGLGQARRDDGVVPLCAKRLRQPLEQGDVFTNEQDIGPTPMPGTDGRWATTRFVDPADMRHDMHMTIVTLEPGAVIPFAETHVMEHGLYVLEGKAVYRLNQDWVEVEAGDYMWLRAFCPQACYAGGPGKFRYLLYKDVNRHAKLGGAGIAKRTS